MRLGQMLVEERVQLVPGDELDPVIQVDVPGTWHDQQFLGLGRPPVGVFTELARVRLLARDEQHGARRYRLDVVKRVKVHELDVAGQRRVRRPFARRPCRREFAARGAIKVVELALNGMRIGIDSVHGAAGVGDCATGKFHVALPRRFGNDLLALRQRLRMVQRVAVGSAHVVHADGGDGLHARIDLGGTDDETAAAANAENADALPVDERLGAQIVDRRAERLGVDIGRHGIARLAGDVAPERLIDGQRDKTLFGQFLRVQVRALLLHRAHRVADDDRALPGIGGEVLGREQIADDLHLVLAVETDLVRSDCRARVEVVSALGYCCPSLALRGKRRAARDGKTAQGRHASAGRLQKCAARYIVCGHIRFSSCRQV